MAEVTGASAEQAVSHTQPEVGAEEEAAPPPEKQVEDESKDKRNAVEELKAAIMKAAAGVQKDFPASQKVTSKKPEVETLKAFCLCVRRLATDHAVCKELEQVLPRLVVSSLAPLVGVEIAAPAADSKATAPQTSQRLFARVKSYNSRKGFGFLEMPGYTRDIFVFNAHLIGRMGLIAGEQVEFTLMVDGGRPQARQVRVLSNAEQVSPNQNPILAMKQSMASLPPEIALAMASMPTDIPTPNLGGGHRLGNVGSTGDQLFDKIREAQASSATGKRQQYPDTDAFAREAAEAVRKAQAAKEASSQRWTAGPPPAAAEGDAGGSGQHIAVGARVRIINAPSNNMNNHIGTVKSYDSASERYSVVVSTQQGGPGENSPLKLKAEQLKVEQEGSSLVNAAAAALQSAPAPLPGSVNKSSALQRSANEALKRFGQLAQQQPQLPHQQHSQPQASQWLGGMHPGAPFGAGPPMAPMGSMCMGKGMGFPPHPGMGAVGHGMFGAGAPGAGMGAAPPGPVSAGMPGTMGGKGADMRQRVSLEDGFPKKPAASAAQRPAQATGTPIEHFARPAVSQQMPNRGLSTPGTAAGSIPQQLSAQPQGQQQRPPAQQRQEGRPGVVWRVLESKDFADVIVRETSEVGSRELRRHRPGDQCTQRGPTITLPSGLVRMPVAPNGWVTVHARHIGGPTFLEELDEQPPPPQQDARPPQGVAQPSVPKQAPPRRDDIPRPQFAGDDPYHSKATDQWAGKSAAKGAKGGGGGGDAAGPSPVPRHTMLAVREALQQAGQLHRGDGPRMLHMPHAESSAPRERDRREQRRDRDRDREGRRGGDFERPEGDADRAAPPAPLGVARTQQGGTRPGQGGGTADAPAAAVGEENKANCPTQ